MRLLYEAIIAQLEEKLSLLPASGGPPVAVLGGVRIGHVSDPDMPPDRPIITLMRQGGGSIVPIAGAETPFMLVQVWSRKDGDEAIRLYDWVSSRLNMRHKELTTKMGGNGICWEFVRQWRSDPLFDDVGHEWYVTARYYSQTVDFADTYSAFGA